MSSRRPCMIDRWGKGSGSERQSDSAASKEAAAKLAAMIKERERQDALWGRPKEDSDPSSKIKLK